MSDFPLSGGNALDLAGVDPADTGAGLRAGRGAGASTAPAATRTAIRLPLRAGQVFARYRVLNDLGRGAMATVYRAADENDGRIVALKVLSLAEDWPEDRRAEARLRLLREADAVGRIDHPDIVRVYEAGEFGGLVYLALEFVEGVSLAVHAGQGRLLPPRMVCEICARVGEVLNFAHQRGVIHRDIKPANLIFDQANRRIRVMDFGVARFVDSQATRTGIVLGSPSYMAPEQLEGIKVDGPADQFSLGVTLFQLLTGQLPFRSDTIPGLMYAIIHDPHPPLATIRPDLPADLGRIIDRAMAKEPAARFDSALEFALAVRDVGRTIPAAMR